MANSYVLYNGDGIQTDWAVPFPYIDPTHVEVLANGNTQTYVWVNSGVVRLSPAAATGVTVEVRRRTPVIPLVDYVDGVTQTADQMNLSHTQGVYLGQEARDEADRYQAFATAASNSATSAATSASQAAATLVNFEDLNLGAKTSAPTTDNFGQPILPGALYLNITSNQWFGWNGTAWIQLPSASTVLTFKGRAGNVLPATGDYTAAQVTNAPAGNISATDVQTALAQLDARDIATATLTKSADYPVVAADTRKTFSLTGANTTLTFPNSVTGFDANHVNIVTNSNTTNGNKISLPSGTIYLGPKQTLLIALVAGSWFPLGQTRFVIPAPTSLFVDPALGNDNNCGFTSSFPLRTINAAFMRIRQTWDCNGNVPTIKCAHGTYLENIVITGHLLGMHYVMIDGDTAGPTSCIIQATGANQTLLYAKDYGYCKIQGFIMQSGGFAGVYGIAAEQHAGIDISGIMEFADLTGGRVIYAGMNGNVNLEAIIYIVGNANFVLIAQNGGYITHNNQINLPSGQTFNTFAWADVGGRIYVSGGTIAGGGITGTIGTRYQAYTGGIINTNGAGATYWPGSIAGSTGSGGIYA